VKRARENSAQYRQRLLEWEKKVIAEGHPELVRRVNMKKASPATPRVSAKLAAKRAQPKAAAAAAKPKTGVKNAPSQMTAPARSAGKATEPKSTASHKKKMTVEE